MPRTALTVGTAPGWGGGVLDIAAAAVDNSNGNTFVNTGVERLIVINGSGGSLTVTVALPTSSRSLGGLVTTKTYTVGAGKTAILGPFDPGTFNQSTGVVNVDWSTGTSVTAAVVNHTATP